MVNKLILIIVLLHAFTRDEAFGQKLKSDGWKITIKSWEEQRISFYGKEQIGYTGSIKVQRDNKEFGIYRTYLIRMNDTLRHLAVYSGINLIEPRLYWNEADKSFTYKRDDSPKMTIMTQKNSDNKEIMLSGMLIWLNQLE